jgi:hypothetical protein
VAVSRVFRKLEEGGAVQLGNRGIVVKDMGVLERLEEAHRAAKRALTILPDP